VKGAFLSTLIDRCRGARAVGRAAPRRPRFWPARGDAGAEAARPARGARVLLRPRGAGAAAGAGAASSPRRGFRRGAGDAERVVRGRASAALVRPRGCSNACTGSSASSPDSSESGRWRFGCFLPVTCVEDGDAGGISDVGDAGGAGDGVLPRDESCAGAAAREGRTAATGTARRRPAGA